MGGFIQYISVAPAAASSGLPLGLSLASAPVDEAPCVAPLCSVGLIIPSFERSFEVLGLAPIVSISGAISGDISAAMLSGSMVLIVLLSVAIAVLIWSFNRAARCQKDLRDERDAALMRVEALQALTERDPLTGLLNRRVVEERFAKLRSAGFDTFALIDLDQFKAVNDRYGHQVGDDVLAACGDALKGGEDRDYLTMRLGGEEFVVLLRGVDAYYRAETLRKSIPLRVARAVPALEQHVTASMGLIELPRESHELLSFSELYSRADQLLYNAKASGRDRTCFERLTVLNEAPPVRGDAKSAA